MIASKQWAAALTVLLGLGVVISSCSSDDNSGASSTSCTFAGNACEFGCSPSLGCVQCLTNADCEPGAPICDSLGNCSECETSDDCATGQVCEPATHNCAVPCTTSVDCEQNNGNDNASICDTATTTCVGCITAADCPAAAPLCDATRKQCSQCVSRSDCGVAAPACNLQTGQCEECLVDADCNGTGACAQDHTCHPFCTSNADCAENDQQDIIGNGDICNTTSGACVECVTAADCTDPEAPLCSEQNRCVACSVDADCSAPTPFCSQLNRGGQGQNQRENVCVACLVATDCSATKPICSTMTGACVACQTDADCPDATLPNCDDTGICIADN